MNKIMDVLCIYVDLDLSDQHDVDLDAGNVSAAWQASPLTSIMAQGPPPQPPHK